MELIHILPRKSLDRNFCQKYELYLADEVLKYPDEYRMLVRGKNSYKILDNSLNELGTSVSMEKLNKAAKIIEPDEFVLPDDIDPDKSRAVTEEALRTLERYKHLKSLRKMAVVHASTFRGYINELLRFNNDSRVDVVGIPKVVAERAVYPGGLNGRVSVLAFAITFGYSKDTHFLGWAGFKEFEGYEYLTSRIRSMDSRLMLEAGDLWIRDDILSHVDLGESEIKDVPLKVERVRKVADKFGLR